MQKKPLPEFWRDQIIVSTLYKQFFLRMSSFYRVRFNTFIFFVQPADTSKIHNCIPDEHYVPTLLAVRIFSFPFYEHYCNSFNIKAVALLVLIGFFVVVFFLPNLAKRPWKGAHTKVSDTYCLGYFQLKRTWAPRMASSDLQILRRYSNADKIYKGLKQYFKERNWHSEIWTSHYYSADTMFSTKCC